jgi:ParB family chromosome partitioning protein
MAKSYLQSAEASSAFLNPVPVEGDKDKKGERVDTTPLREARFIDIERIKPDPNQPRKIFDENALESLAESIRELGEIIDPLTVEYDDQQDFFKIISGERRFRAAKMVGLERLPCILKDVDDKKRILLQLIANLQRENITSLEESAGIRALIEKFSYSQVQIAKIFNKSNSYISQILGLERLTPSAKEIIQTSELSKEVLIQASREKVPEKQVEILKKASSEGQTVKQIREDLILDTASFGKDVPNKPDTSVKSFKKWTWSPEDKGFVITIQFKEKQNKAEKAQALRAAIDKTQKHLIKID